MNVAIWFLLKTMGPGASWATFRFLAEDLPWETKQIHVPAPHSVTGMNAIIELVVAGLGLFCSVALFIYHSNECRKFKAAEKSYIKRIYWIPDRVNACVIPLVIGIGAVILYFITN